ncbi:Integrin alpha-7 [Camelus dromedarius]|uniref:Integrin alpha-7 n=1 Tax=Camelus dromedarius TaxID=9838 RepID=A0A5N4DET4_CAMDR|nr:Integrin alpha-7 [Camelus dromedarius]
MRAEELSFVAAAPRANHKGAVVILRKDSASRLVPEVTLSGERLASGFGYSLAVADLNNDGWTDLVVGAPYFFELQEELGGAVSDCLSPAPADIAVGAPFDGDGKVFIYHGSSLGLVVTASQVRAVAGPGTGVDTMDNGKQQVKGACEHQGIF